VSVIAIVAGKWQRVQTGLGTELRVCPECAAAVYGPTGQRAHGQWHLELDDLLSELAGKPAAGTQVEDGEEDEPARPAWWKRALLLTCSILAAGGHDICVMVAADFAAARRLVVRRRGPGPRPAAVLAPEAAPALPPPLAAGAGELAAGRAPAPAPGQAGELAAPDRVAGAASGQEPPRPDTGPLWATIDPYVQRGVLRARPGS
jgi:hypothetical protein